jgi:Bacterial Ig domain
MLKKNSILSLVVIATIGLTSHVQAQIASFSFSAAAVSVSGWTNLHGNPAGTTAITATANGVTVSSIGGTHWAPYTTDSSAYNGLGAYPGTYFPANVMSNDWFQYNGSSRNLANYNAAVPQLKVSGLNPDSTYILRMSGSNTKGFVTNPTIYTVAGLIGYGSQNLNAQQNETQGVTFEAVKPDSTGAVYIWVNTTTTTDIAPICGLQVFSGLANVGTPAVTITAPANGTVFAEGGNFSIQATASEAGATITKVEFYADTTKIGEDDTAPYTFTWVDPSPGAYQLTAKATDNVGTINTASVYVDVTSLNYFWSTTGNIATNGDSNFIGSVDTNRLSFRTNNIERMTILKDGTIGIGTKTTYGYALAVNGTGIFTKVKVKTAGTWPDYVFGKDYHLPDLHELEAYLARYHHLPDIASEAEVQRDGIDVGDHQAALLKKVEELTLYLIDENKKLQVQADRIEQQQKEIDELKKLIAEKK